MFMAYTILGVSTGLLFFYLQTLWQKVLRREFKQQYFLAIVKANQLGFASIHVALEEAGKPIEYSRVRTSLKCDFLTLAYLLKNAANLEPRYSGQHRLVMLYFHLMLFALSARHLLKLQEKTTLLKLTTILRYLANLVGQRASLANFANLSASEYLQSL